VALSAASAEFAGRFRTVLPTPAAARADSLRHAEAEIAVFAGFPEVYRSTSQPESQRQSRRTSPTKINKEVISKHVRNGRSEV
jgi:hypothetical protein